MSKLSKLKDWVTLGGAAQLLSTAFSEQVTLSDIYQLALEGRLALSVRLLMPVDACHLIPAPIATARRVPGLAVGSEVILDFMLDEDTALKQDGDRLQIVGVYDLPMLGAERVMLEQLYAQSIGSAEPDMVSLEMVFLRDGADGFYRLVEMFTIETDEGEEPMYGYGSKAFLPEDSQLVVRPSYLANLLKVLAWINDAPVNRITRSASLGYYMLLANFGKRLTTATKLLSLATKKLLNGSWQRNPVSLGHYRNTPPL